MQVKVKLLRQRGARRSNNEIGADAGIVGDMVMHSVNGHYQVKINSVEDHSRQSPLLPVLFDAVMVSMTGNRMMFRGFERQGDQADAGAPTVMQEWAVEVMASFVNR